MAQTGYTPILIYSSSTASNAPAVGNLTNSTLGSELAINITDGKLFYKDNANAIQVIGWKTTPTTAGGTGLTSYTAGDLLYYATGTTLSKLAIGASGRWLGSSGTAPQWNAPAALTKTDDTNVTLTLGGSASTALLNAASLTLGWTGTLSVARGGTGLSAVSAGYIPFGNSATALTTSGDLTFASNVLEVYSTVSARNGTGNASLRLRSNVSYFEWLARAGTNNLVMYDGGTGFDLLTLNATNYDFTVNRGNLVQGTAAKGFNFTANTPASGSTSQLLNWYEEGTWTPADASGAGLSFTSASGYYTRKGREVTVVFTLVYPATANASAARIGGLPFTAANTNNGFNVGTFNTNNSGQNIQPSIVANATNFAALLVATGTSATNVQLTGATLRGGLTYFV